MPHRLDRREFLATVSALAAGVSCSSDAPDQPLELWYDRPAGEWVEALPVGNGRLGAMVFGGSSRERIQFNEDTVWAGEPRSYAHKGAHTSLDAIRELLFEGRQKEAEDLAMERFMSTPLRQVAYQPFGDLRIERHDIDANAVTGYRRSLDLRTAIAHVQFNAGGTVYRQEVLVSYPKQVLAVHLAASGERQLSFSAMVETPHLVDKKAVSGDVLRLAGRVRDGVVQFEAGLAIRTDGDLSFEGGRATVKGASDAFLILAGASNVVDFRDVSADPAVRVDEALEGIRGSSYEEVRDESTASHGELFDRVRLDLGTTEAASEPTDARIVRFSERDDPQLVTLLFQYGRFLLIASSRGQGQPSNLQGLWNELLTPPWESKYTVNINTEMNYWPAESTAIPETQEPLFAAMAEVAESGAETAREHYDADGWVLHHNFDLWRGTAPINHSNHGIWPTGGAWLCQNFWQRYLYSGDVEFLRETGYPIMRGASRFFADVLVESPENGHLISGPSNSPETGGLVMGPTMDHQIIRNLMGNTIAASEILGVDEEFRDELRSVRSRIAPNTVGRLGQLQEWQEDIDDPDNKHRHVSHLFGLHPGVEITPYGTPELFSAARRSLEMRGDGATGWSMGWKVNFWARLLDGDHAFRILAGLLGPVGANAPNQLDGRRGGLYPNMFDAHPPFQIDGNFGATAGIVEMLLQSHDPYGAPLRDSAVQRGEAGFLHLLPALPAALPSGRIEGLRARNGFEVDIEWDDGALVQARVVSRLGKPVTIRYAGSETKPEIAAGESLVVSAASLAGG